MRILSVWLPRWPILRFITAQARNSTSKPIAPEKPFILVADAPGGPRIAALNGMAESLGLMVGDQVADARATVGGGLQTHSTDPGADRAALRRLALWATRYTPAVSPWGEENGADGLFLDVSGACHLFGGEAMLLAELSYRLDCFGLPARLAIARTAGMAWALSHFHSSPAVALNPGREAESLAALPIGALRLSSETCTALRRLGFKRIGSLLDKPRAPFAARFSSELFRRIDQALGHAPEPLSFIVSQPVYHAVRQLLEPIVTREAIVAVTARLMKDLVSALARGGMGAKTLQLSLYRVDGERIAVDVGLTLPTRDPGLVVRLVDLKLERVVETIDAGFGFEAVGLAVVVAERMDPKQTELSAVADRSMRTDLCAALVDSLRHRFGPQSVRQLRPAASHLPERAEMPNAPRELAATWPVPDRTRHRPILLLTQAEQIEVTALVPEGAPRRFRWRGATHDVARAQGPERIADEWWRHQFSEPTRDYYFVESNASKRFWVYREGLYGRETAAPRWFVHGLFA